MVHAARLFHLVLAPLLGFHISANVSLATLPGDGACSKSFSAVGPKASRLYQSSGDFTKATDDQHDALGKKYLQAGVIKQLEGKIERVQAKDLAVDLNQVSPAAMNDLIQSGRQELPRLYYLTSGAGLWSRGGGQVKALIPFNIKDLLSKEEFAFLVKSGDIANASKIEDVLKLANRELRPGENSENVAADIVAERKVLLSRVIERARLLPDSMNPIDMKIANVAIESKKAKTYIPFDIWTSEQTHEPIRRYLEKFAKDFQTKRFHPNSTIDKQIKSAIGDYVAESAKRGETHLFGYQVGFHALDQKTGKEVKNTALIGEGAGMARAFLDESGRTAALRAQGKGVWVFENIEVITDLPVAMGAYQKAGKPVGVILVPEKPGYKGGSPFLIERNGATNLELHEMSALPEEFANGNPYFNSNTIFQSFDLAPPQNIGFEVKNSGTGKIVRAKMNAGDITHEAPTAGIGGRIGVEYENFKNYLEFGENGSKLIDTYRAIWARDI